jgi:hypothetical protein
MFHSRVNFDDEPPNVLHRSARARYLSDLKSPTHSNWYAGLRFGTERSEVRILSPDQTYLGKMTKEQWYVLIFNALCLYSGHKFRHIPL